MIEYKEYENGFKYIEVSNTSATAKIALQGAHLFYYERRGEDPLIWLSRESYFKKGKAIRGGVPICWPWFGENKNDPSLPQHGFVRDSLWELVKTDEPTKNSTTLVFRIKDSDKSFKLWPFRFELELEITISHKLSISLTTKNLDEKDMEITQALHTYLCVSDISDVRIKGLDETSYFDKLSSEFKTQFGDIIIDCECDRVYQNPKDDIILCDKKRIVTLSSKGSSSVVVWNPWVEKSAAMSGMEKEGYRGMVCIENANALDDLKIIKSNQSHKLSTVIF